MIGETNMTAPKRTPLILLLLAVTVATGLAAPQRAETIASTSAAR